MVSVRKVVLVTIDLMSIALTLWTGLHENPVLVGITRRYDSIRSRLREGRITYDHVRVATFDVITKLPDLIEQAATNRLYTAPDRSQQSLGEDRSTCLHVNSMSTPVLTLNYNDFFGTGARREQVYVYSISAPSCSIINFKLGWYDHCIHNQFGGNATACQVFILEHFDELRHVQEIQAGVPKDFGERGTPFLRCQWRPAQPFLYMTDLVVYQSYWEGGSYHLEIQSSRCWAMPLVQTSDETQRLFQTMAVDDRANVVFGAPPVNAFAHVVSLVYGVVSISMIVRGLVIAFSLRTVVVYVPSMFRHRLFGIPLPSINRRAASGSTKRVDIVLSYEYSFVASDLWMNHWVYITLSILDSFCSIRTTYVVLEMGSWMLSKKRNNSNFIFVCTAIAKVTWIMCMFHTLFRYVVQIIVHVCRSISWLRESRFLRFVAWYVDAVALFMSYKLYTILLSAVLLVMYATTKCTTLMKHQAFYKQPMYGGSPNLASFWQSEIVCDLFVLCSLQLVAAHAMVSMVLLTPYRRATSNHVLRLLQKRYVFVGWDVVAAMQALGIDPLNDALVNNDDVVMTNCSLGALVQQLYLSGPSNLVEFVGDDVFTEIPDQDRGLIRYPLEIAQSMGLLRASRSTSIAPWELNQNLSSQSAMDQAREPPLQETSTPSTNLEGHRFHIHAEWWWGRILLIDPIKAPGRLRKSDDILYEYVIQHAFALIPKEDVRSLLSAAPSLHLA